jgi:hypothetical protein
MHLSTFLEIQVQQSRCHAPTSIYASMMKIQL